MLRSRIAELTSVWNGAAMRPIISWPVCVLILGTTVAFAEQEPARPTDPAPAQSTSAPAPAPTATTTSSTTPASSPAAPSSAAATPPAAEPVSKDATERADAEKHLIANGFKLHVGKDG